MPKEMLSMAAAPQVSIERIQAKSDVVAAEVHAPVVEIGGIPIRLLTDNADLLCLIHHRYAGFLTSKQDADIDLTFDLVPPGRISSEEDVRVVHDGPRWSAERADFRLDWDSQGRCGRVRQSINPYSLDAALRILHTLLLASRGGFLLHAASAVRDGRAFLFFGSSGAGKTTLARLAPSDAKLLTDEISYVRRNGAQYLAYGTPFSGELANTGENIGAPIAGLYHLVKATTNRLDPMKSADAARVLLESVLFFAEDPSLVKMIFRSVCDLVYQQPVYRLEFVPEQTVWGLIQ
jgi:hypothetical protein